MNKENLIIIGSGPAGLTAGIYAARADLKPLILEGPTPGGQLISTSYVENWPGEKKILGHELMKKMREQAQEAGCRFAPERVKQIDRNKKPFTITTDKENKFSADAIIIASGATPRRLNCPGEDTYWGKGVSTCAVCDGLFYKDKPVVIIGGGDTAMENASFLAKFTNNITVIHILEKLTASAAMQKRVLENKAITVLYESTVTEFKGDGSHLQEVVVTNKKTGQQKTIPAFGAFVSIGMIPNTKFLQEVVDLDKWGYVQINQNKKLGQTSTSTEGIFAAGDAFDYRYKQAITAAGFGCMAALDAQWYLTELQTG